MWFNSHQRYLYHVDVGLCGHSQRIHIQERGNLQHNNLSSAPALDINEIISLVYGKRRITPCFEFQWPSHLRMLKTLSKTSITSVTNPLESLSCSNFCTFFRIYDSWSVITRTKTRPHSSHDNFITISLYLRFYSSHAHPLFF